jgi:hypothetical protein
MAATKIVSLVDKPPLKSSTQNPEQYKYKGKKLNP